jgi:alanyl-tRNA synthetase
VRRIEAVTGTEALRTVIAWRHERSHLASLLKTTPQEVIARTERLLEDLDRMRRELQSTKGQTAREGIQRAVEEARAIGGWRFAWMEAEVGDLAELRHLGDLMRARLGKGVGVLFTRSLKKPMALVVCSDEAVAAGMSAHELVRRVGEKLGLRGGGKPHMAQLGLQDPGQAEALRRSIEEGLGD